MRRVGTTMRQGKRVHHEKERRGRSVGGVVHKRRRRSHMRLIKVPPTTTRIRRIRCTPTIVVACRRAARAIPPRDTKRRGKEKKQYIRVLFLQRDFAVDSLLRVKNRESTDVIAVIRENRKMFRTCVPKRRSLKPASLSLSFLSRKMVSLRWDRSHGFRPGHRVNSFA